MPLDYVEGSKNYWIKASYKGSQAIEPVIKRKNAEYDHDRAQKVSESDFNRRYSKAFTKGLRDHRYASAFSLTADKTYSDDP